jgi:hypothetical protein
MSERQYTITHPVGPAIASEQQEYGPPLRKAPNLSPLVPLSELMTALAAAQAEMSNAAYNQQNPHFKSKYADLASIRDATIPALTKHGLSIHQVMQNNSSGNMVLATRLGHASGSWIESLYPIPYSDKPHIMGSAITYARRYSWAAICGIAAEEDEDGNAANDAAKNGKSLPALPARKSSAAAKRDGDWEKFKQALADCQSAREVERLRTEYQAQQYHAWNADWRDVAEETFEKRLAEFSGADLKQTLQDSLEEDSDTGRAHLRDQLIEDIQMMESEEDLLVWKESPAFRRDLAILPKPMQLAVRKAGAMKLETLQKAAQ